LHNTHLPNRTRQFVGAVALVIILISLPLNTLPAYGGPLSVGEGDPLPLTDATATVSYDPPRNPWPASATPEPTVAPSPTPSDLKPEVEHSVKPDDLGLLKYIVVQGDTVSGIAETFGLKQDSITWANPEIQNNPAALKIGQELWIPPLNGAVHTIVAGDTILGIAGKYGVTVDDILNCYYNNITDVTLLQIGDKILVPGATRGPSPSVGGAKKTQLRYAARPPEGAATGTGAFIWPVSGRLSQGYSASHRAIDIGGWTGRPIVAADTGFVVQCGWDNSGYGNTIVIDHGGGVLTRYAHLNTMSVQAGDTVSQGDVIGQMGTTGRSTGPHLHFEIIINGYQKNPMDYLP